MGGGRGVAWDLLKGLAEVLIGVVGVFVVGESQGGHVVHEAEIGGDGVGNVGAEGQGINDLAIVI